MADLGITNVNFMEGEPLDPNKLNILQANITSVFKQNQSLQNATVDEDSFIFLLFTILPVFAFYTIKGKIIDANTQNPLDFVNVALYKQDAETPAAGKVPARCRNPELP
jgi:hypothetical protein